MHLPDFFFAKPVFLDGDNEPIAWAGIVTHMVDVGGRFPGGISVTASALWEEGLVIPIVPLVQRGALNQAVLDIIAANVREPSKVLGDIRAALAGLDTCERQIRELADRLGRASLREQMDAFLEHSERATRSAPMALPDGEATAEGFLDDDGYRGPAGAALLHGDQARGPATFDYAGTDRRWPAASTARSATRSVSTFVAGPSSARTPRQRWLLALRRVLDPGRDRRQRAAPGGGQRPRHPALPPDRRGRRGDGPADPRSPAGGRRRAGLITFSGARAGRCAVDLPGLPAGGWGATSAHDGVAGASHAISNTGNIPIEAIEAEFPLRVTATSCSPTRPARVLRGAPARLPRVRGDRRRRAARLSDRAPDVPAPG